MLGIFLGASVIWFFPDFRLDDFKIPFGGPFLHFDPWLSYILTVIWIISITNAVNLIDGLDGLVSGVSIISFGDDGDCFSFLSPSAQSLLDHDDFCLSHGHCWFLPF